MNITNPFLAELCLDKGDIEEAISLWRSQKMSGETEPILNKKGSNDKDLWPETIRDLIKQENDLVASRIGWMLTFPGLSVYSVFILLG